MLARVVADARQAMRPHTLPPVPRLRLLDAAFKKKAQREANAGARQAIVVIGDGGVGKSVLLGQLLTAFDDRPDPFFDGAVVLVSCAGVILPDGKPGRDDVDQAIGRAVGALGRKFAGLLATLSNLKAEHGRVTLLVDTLDLLLGSETLPALADVVADALDIGDVLITCRKQEFGAYLGQPDQSAPRLAARIVTAMVPALDPDEILQWANGYLGASGRVSRPEDSAFLGKLAAGVSRRGSIWEVCSVPVRLALVCEVFAEEGDLPEDLTVTTLYNQYWQARVARHAGQRSPLGDAKEHAALAVAAEAVTETGQLRLRVPTARLEASSVRGLGLLASEGVLTELASGWEFFHQTFAEYTVARWMLTFGTDGPPVSQLAEHLRAGHTNLWPVAGSVLLQADRYSDYVDLAERLDLRGPEGAKWHAVAALRQSTSEALKHVVEKIAGNAHLWKAVLPELGSAPRHADTVPETMIAALRQSPVVLVGPVTVALATWLSRNHGNTAQALASALRALSEVRTLIKNSELDQHVAKLVRTQLGQSVTPATLAVLSSSYVELGALGRQAVARVYLGVASQLTEEQISAFAGKALLSKCPPLSDEESASLLRLFWSADSVRTERAWDDWRDLMAADLPAVGWHNAKVKFMVELADTNEEVRLEIVQDLLDDRLTGEIAHINTFEQIADRSPAWLTRILLSRPAPTRPRSLGAVTSVADALVRALPQSTALELMRWVSARRLIDPRQVWPAEIVLAGRSVNIHRQIFDELVAAGESQPVLDSAIDAWLFRSAPQVIDELRDDLRLLLAAADPDTLQNRARLEGRLVLSDPQARGWINTHVVNHASSRVAGTAVKTVSDTVKTLGHPVDGELAGWLTGLIATPHIDAAMRVLNLIGDRGLVDNTTYAAIAPQVVPAVAGRIDETVIRRDPPQFVRALLDCLIRADQLSPVAPELVRHLYAQLADRVKVELAAAGAENVPAVVNNIAKLCGTLMARRLPADEVREHIGTLLAGFDPADAANRTVRSVASMLVGIQGRDAQALDWMERLYGENTTTLGVRLAIAEAFLVHDHRQPGGRASKLKDRPDSPPQVAAYIVNHTRD
ncbi:hypothetical protein [Micromonospora sp. RL09-050-HVF-A]|uniref:hypothetical protein n=1 Tax=Micromonospora sp. RL09-050-HVF-A TaxID=1703433 RepID=UPI001C6059F2|nr:hypothetical protein [Micromonospora sp. RL09-050-HVF-A]MBW4705197.1 hypothetical protein [Micromonospora sp. RL09-050-HVF-A]